jgi:hypothetical protein
MGLMHEESKKEKLGSIKHTFHENLGHMGTKKLDKRVYNDDNDGEWGLKED